MDDSTRQYLLSGYKKAQAEVHKQIRALENAKGALAIAKDLLEHYGQVLRDGGVDPENPHGLLTKASIYDAFRGPNRESTNGHSSAPINNTHAVFMAMKKHNNEGFTPEGLAELTQSEDFKLTVTDVSKVFWRQTQPDKKNMEKLEDGRVRLTPKGLKVMKFRRKATVEPTLAMT